MFVSSKYTVKTGKGTNFQSIKKNMLFIMQPLYTFSLYDIRKISYTHVFHASNLRAKRLAPGLGLQWVAVPRCFRPGFSWCFAEFIEIDWRKHVVFKMVKTTNQWITYGISIYIYIFIYIKNLGLVTMTNHY
jgi:hypothetical protein